MLPTREGVVGGWCMLKPQLLMVYFQVDCQW